MIIRGNLSMFKGLKFSSPHLTNKTIIEKELLVLIYNFVPTCCHRKERLLTYVVFILIQNLLQPQMAIIFLLLYHPFHFISFSLCFFIISFSSLYLLFSMKIYKLCWQWLRWWLILPPASTRC